MSIEEAEEHLQELQEKDRVTAEDLERFRRSLPTEPRLARIVNKVLPPPWGGLFEFVEGSERQSAYWRLRPDRTEPRSEADRRAREVFGDTHSRMEGSRGTRSVLRETEDGLERVRLPPGALEAARELQGRDFHQEPDTSFGERALQRLHNLLNRGD